MRLIIEALGWVLMGIGAYHILQKEATIYHYIMGIIGVALIIRFFPIQDFKRVDRHEDK